MTTAENHKGFRLNILVVDDEANIRKTLGYCLNKEGHRVVSVGNAADALREIARSVFDAAFLDLRLGSDDGMDLIPRILSESPWLKVVVITAYASIESAVEAMRRGAIDYIEKPFTVEQVKALIQNIARMRALESEIAALKDDINRLEPRPEFHSQNAAMQKAIETARKAAASQAIILLQGESGTGKSALARIIHQWSNRSAHRMTVVSCPAVPSGLLESELFGHIKGAFTGAVRDNPGRIATCEGGTLFLDEIADLPSAVQAKLLRFIQDREYERVGDPTPRKADIRIIAATNADLNQCVAKGLFREDLFYRLNVINIAIPPLRDRPEDILPMALRFLKFFSCVNRKTFTQFTEKAIQKLKSHAWPGNIRELRNVVERAVILGSGEAIDHFDLPETFSPAKKEPRIGDPLPLSKIEELHIRGVLSSSESLQAAAEALGIDQATLWRRRKTYGI